MSKADIEAGVVLALKLPEQYRAATSLKLTFELDSPPRVELEYYHRPSSYPGETRKVSLEYNVDEWQGVSGG